MNKITAFASWQRSVAQPFTHGGWALNRTRAVTEDGAQASILATYRGPGQAWVRGQLEQHGVVSGSELAAVDAERAAAKAAAGAGSGDGADVRERTMRAFGITTGGGAPATEAGALQLRVVADDDRALRSPFLQHKDAQRGFQPVTQATFDSIMAARAAAAAVGDDAAGTAIPTVAR